MGIIFGVILGQRLSEYYDLLKEKESERLMRQEFYRVIDSGDKYQIRRSAYNGKDYVI